MPTETQKPLYTLTIEEFITLNEKLIERAMNKYVEKHEELFKADASQDVSFDINELAGYLRCSKVSIHSYKKLGMPFYKIGRKLLFKKEEVLQFMKSFKNKRVIPT
jgi:excisionase family DNA binding protein